MKNILLVDDEKDILEILSDLLIDYNHKITTADNTKKALELLKSNHFDVIVSDIKMPIMSGLDFYYKAKELYPKNFKKFIFMTGYAEIDRQDALRIGADEFLSKPIDLMNFLKIIDAN